MVFKSPGSVAFEYGIIHVHWYGLIIAASFLIGMFIVVYIARENSKTTKAENPDNTANHIIDMSTYTLIAAIVGARLYYAIFNWSYFSNNPSEIYQVWNGGLSIHGAIIGGFFALLAYAKINKLNLLKYSDFFCYGLIIGQATGRWGNFFNSEAFGKPTDIPCRLYIPPEARPPQYINEEYFHPAFFYESIWNILVFCILYFILKRFSYKRPGLIMFSYLFLYSLGRIIIEAIRIDSIYNFLGIPVAQWMSLLLMITGTAGIIFVVFCNKERLTFR
jgi:phosphatidylglycerol:prolipoprotein diacylglycerol transferase